MIYHFAINVAHNFNLFPAKVGVLDQYSPHIILLHRNWNYNKHFQVEFGDYVQASKVIDTNNKNFPTTIDGIYLYPAPNL